jgi:hypothetical protein
MRERLSAWPYLRKWEIQILICKLTRIKNVRSPATPKGPYHTFAVEYSHAFGNVGHLICKCQSCLEKIKPLQEEDILFLLLDRYVKSTGNGVYIKIKQPPDIQVYDSDVKEPMVRFEHLNVPRRTLKFRKHTRHC